MNHLKYVFILFFLISPKIKSETLKSLAAKSTVLLYLSDDSSAQKKCGLTVQKISILSQSLKARIDTKIKMLTARDFEILNGRSEICHQDCSCAIYSLAFETQNKQNQVIAEKALKETFDDRKVCVSKIKNICQIIK